MKTIGERIRQAREARKLSGEELATLVGYSHQSAIGNLENRAGGSGGSKIAKIAEALNVPVAWLLNGPDSTVVPFLDKPYQTAQNSRNSGAAPRVSEPVQPIFHKFTVDEWNQLPPDVRFTLESFIEAEVNRHVRRISETLAA